MAFASIGVFGGSFDPIHNGHLVAARQVLDQLGLAKVVFVPAGQQWQKTSGTAARDRLDMVRIAIEGHPGFEVSDVDVLRSGPTYTVDTLAQLASQNPGSGLVFILGADAMAGIASWHQSERLTDLAEFVVVSRPGSNVHIPEIVAERTRVLDIPALDISSTSVRELLGAGQDVASLVPAGVLRYIEEHKLYEGRA